MPILFTSVVYRTNVYWSVIHGIKRKPHLSVLWNWYHFVAIAILHQPRPTDSADINKRLQLSDTSSIPPMHGGFLLALWLGLSQQVEWDGRTLCSYLSPTLWPGEAGVSHPLLTSDRRSQATLFCQVTGEAKPAWQVTGEAKPPSFDKWQVKPSQPNQLRFRTQPATWHWKLGYVRGFVALHLRIQFTNSLLMLNFFFFFFWKKQILKKIS